VEHAVRPRRVAAAAERGRLSLSLLRGFELRLGNRPCELPPAAERLLAFLALHGGSPHRSFVAGALWPETSDGRAAASLRSSLWRIRQAAPALVEASTDRIRLGPTVEVDVEDLKTTIRKVLEGAARLRLPDVAKLLAGGELLPGWWEEWVIGERERLRQLRLHALEYLCQRLIEERRFILAEEAGWAAVTEEPLRESAHRILIRAYLAQGNAGEAVRQYRRYRQFLEDELGLEPSPEMEGLVRSLVSGSASPDGHR
jgi:DNA-binding SARP family transcriptional activator